MKGLGAAAVRGIGRVCPPAGAIARRAKVWAWPGSALVVPVLDAEPAVAAWLGRDRADFGGAPPHVSVMFPFVPARALSAAVEGAVARLAGDIEPFPFALTCVRRFPGVFYLAPEPAARFVEITDRIQSRWPSYQPYGGVYDAVVPHVTVAFGDQPPADPAVLERALPIATRADELWLIEQSRRGWRTRRRFPLGGHRSAGPDRGGAGAGTGAPG